MSRMLAEQPILTAIVLGFLGLSLAYGWLQSGKKPFLGAGLLCWVLIPFCLWLASVWVTDRERIEQIIYETADAVEQNKHEQAVSIIGDPATRARAMAELPQWEFNQADVGNIQRIRIVEDTSPMQADVEMLVKVEVSSKRGSIKNVRAPRRLFLTFEKRGGPQSDQWVVVDYKHQPPIGQTDGFAVPQSR